MDRDSPLPALLALLDPPGPLVVVDGGFHLGGYARAIWTHCPEARVIGFEPDPDTHARALRNAAHPGLDLRNVALGRETGEAEFFRGAMAATNSLLPRPTTGAEPYYPRGAGLTGGTRVPVARLDDVLREAGLARVDLLKLDLQGGELAALQGATETLSSRGVPIVQCEVVFVEKYADQPPYWEVARFLSRWGYRLHSMTDVKRGPYDPSDNAARNTQWNQADALFVAPSLQARIDAAD